MSTSGGQRGVCARLQQQRHLRGRRPDREGQEAAAGQQRRHLAVRSEEQGCETWTPVVLTVTTTPDRLTDLICLPSVFVFINLMSDNQSSLPKELREKYVMTRQIGT